MKIEVNVRKRFFHKTQSIGFERTGALVGQEQSSYRLWRPEVSKLFLIWGQIRMNEWWEWKKSHRPPRLRFDSRETNIKNNVTSSSMGPKKKNRPSEGHMTSSRPPLDLWLFQAAANQNWLSHSTTALQCWCLFWLTSIQNDTWQKL